MPAGNGQLRKSCSGRILEQISKVSVAPKQRPQPFTLAEISAIVQKLCSDSNLKHYADYVEFKFGVGLRTGEAAALLWRYCSPECDRVWIGESVSNSGT